VALGTEGADRDEIALDLRDELMDVRLARDLACVHGANGRSRL